jgi:hypothetical protein
MAVAYNLARLVYLGLDRSVEVDFRAGLERLEEWRSLDKVFKGYKPGKRPRFVVPG